MSSAWAGGFLTTAPAGKPCLCVLMNVPPHLSRVPQGHNLAPPSILHLISHPTPWAFYVAFSMALHFLPSPAIIQNLGGPLGQHCPGAGLCLGLLPSGGTSFPDTGGPLLFSRWSKLVWSLLGFKASSQRTKKQLVSNSAIIQSSVFKMQRFFCFIYPQLSNCISTAIVILFLFLIAIMENRAELKLWELPICGLPSNVNVLCKCLLRLRVGYSVVFPGLRQEKNTFWDGEN